MKTELVYFKKCLDSFLLRWDI